MIKQIILLMVIVTTSMFGEEFLVKSAEEISDALSSAQPGDILVMQNGEWTNQRIVFEGEGTETDSIYLIAETPGKVILNGTSTLRIAGKYLVVEGLYFKNGYSNSGAVVEFRNSGIYSEHCRLTNSAIVNYNPSNSSYDYKWISLYGNHNRVDHCFIKGKTHSGTTLVVWLDAEPNYHRIDHNHFGYRPELGVNGGETIRIGTSDWSMYDSYTTVENNLFEHCNGEIEIISNKSGNNTFRYNTFFESEGSLTLRHGNKAKVYQNFFIGNGKSNTGGVRIIGEDHLVYNNYFENLRGTGYRSALAIMNGVPDSPLNRYFQVKNAQILFNTFVNCNQTFVLGAGSDSEKTLPPENCTIVNNLVQAQYSIIDKEDEPINLNWIGNIMFGAPLGIDQPEGIKIMDPNLIFAEDSLWRPADNSPVLNSAEGTYTFISEDMDGQTRDDLFDVGSDERSSEPVTNKPLSANLVGAEWYPPPPEPAVVIKVSAGEDSLKNAINGAEANNVIELTTNGGVYSNTSNIKINIPLIIKAATGIKDKPIIRQTNTATSTRIIFEIIDGGSLTLKNLKLDGMAGSETPAKYLIRTDDSPMNKSYSLKIDSCYLKDVIIDSEGNFFRAYEGTFADSIIISNSYFENSGKEGIRLKDEASGSSKYNVDYFEITNSTFWKTNKEAVSIYAGDNVPFTPGPTVYIDHSTFDSCGYNNAAILNLDEVDNSQIKNSIFSNGSEYSPSISVFGIGASISYSNFFNTTEPSAERNAVFGPWNYNYDPKYEDPDLGNFTLPSDSPMLLRSEERNALGDLRWSINEPSMLPIDLAQIGEGTIAVEPEREGMVYYPDEFVTVNVEPAADYIFDGWEGDFAGQDSLFEIRITEPIRSTTKFLRVTGVEDEELIPNEFRLYQNYPNPFNPSTAIEYLIPERSFVSIKIFDATGALVETLINEMFKSGSYSVKWNAGNYSSGVYFILMKAGNNLFTKKALLVK